MTFLAAVVALKALSFHCSQNLLLRCSDLGNSKFMKCIVNEGSVGVEGDILERSRQSLLSSEQAKDAMKVRLEPSPLSSY